MTARHDAFYPHTMLDPASGLTRLRCTFCGKSVSSELVPAVDDARTPQPHDLVVRAIIVCPECVALERLP